VGTSCSSDREVGQDCISNLSSDTEIYNLSHLVEVGTYYAGGSRIELSIGLLYNCEC